MMIFLEVAAALIGFLTLMQKKFASRGLVRQPIEIRSYQREQKYWELFKKHHYLTEDAASCTLLFSSLV